ncbi:MAG TPA: hypothetical protein VNB28_07810, partial [Methylomirabilota bacterium]|nr:hypothetical protein [Methylomirabilota bacterium]
MLSSERPSDEQRGGEAIALESPFLEAGEAPQSRDGLGFALAGEAMSPFATPASPSGALSETDHLLAEALTELRDEAFNESVAYLVEETETAVSERFTDEGPVNAEERERYAEAYLAGVGFEAEQYLNTLEAGLTGLDIASSCSSVS